MQNEKCKMQNYGMGQGPYISIHIFIFEENTFILHSAFSILHFERQLAKLQFIPQYGKKEVIIHVYRVYP